MALSLRASLIHALENTSKPQVVFDLDGTVFDVAPRTIEILKRFLAQKSVKSTFPDEAKRASRIKARGLPYSLEQALHGVGITKESEQNAHFIRLAEDFWYRHFFTNELLTYDEPFAGALRTVEWFFRRGAHIVYLSGRDVPNMSEGTLKSLKAHGFPHRGPRVTLFLKPRYGMEDVLFKKQAMETLSTQGEPLATFDNEPANVAMFLKNFPHAWHFHYLSPYAQDVPLKGKKLRVLRRFSSLRLGR